MFMSDPFERHVFFILPALLLLIMCAPFMFRDTEDTAFWHFNAVLWINAKIGVVTAIILGLGISAALSAIDFLFGIDIDRDLYSDAWALACILFAPFYVFSQIPRDFNAKVAIPAYEVILKFIVNWLLAPLVLVYMVILYAYYLKILFEWNLPNGQLAAITTGFGGVGVSVYMISWPFRETGSVLVRVLHKYFFPALVIPTLMMVVSIVTRLFDYGVTEERYMIALTALWFSAITGMFLLKRISLKYIPLILGSGLVIASFGPWGAISVSGYSQFHRLETLLLKNNILQEGKVVPHEGDISFQEEKDINSIIRYFDRRDELEKIQEDFPLKDGVWKEKSKYNNPGDVIEIMGLDYVSEYMTEKRHSQKVNEIHYRNNDISKEVVISGYDYYYRINGLGRGQKIRHVPSKSLENGNSENTSELEIRLENGIVLVKANDLGTLRFDLATYVANNEDALKEGSKSELSHNLKSEAGDLRGKMIILQVHASKDGALKINNVDFILLLKSE